MGETEITAYIDSVRIAVDELKSSIDNNSEILTDIRDVLKSIDDFMRINMLKDMANKNG